MYRLLRNTVLALAFAGLALPTAIDAQLREIVAKTVSASSSEATLEVHFADEGELRVRFRSGTIEIDGERAGTYTPGSPLDAAWRTLLGEAMALENGALAERLVAWGPPEALGAAENAAATSVDAALERALDVGTPGTEPDAESVEQESDEARELRALREELLEEIRELRSERAELRSEIREMHRTEGRDSFSLTAPFRPVVRGVGGVLEKLILVFMLALVGAGFLSFAGENMETISETARRAPGRAAMVGLAGSFLLIPVWVLGMIALLVSIVGIPVAIAWAPLFPLAACLAALLGYLAVAQNTGEWLANSSFPWTGWIRKSNPLFTLVAGLIGLLLAFMVGHVISILPFLHFFSGLLFAVGFIVTFVAMQIGFGAVLLTRAGRRREYYGGYDADAAWEAAMSSEPDHDIDPDEMGREDL